jgi:Family of unknown function (DUF6527)
MIKLPISWLEWASRKGLWNRPAYLVVDVEEIPDAIVPGIMFREVRGRFPKWAHFHCPRCSETISIPIVGAKGWALRIDFFRRPTLNPSIWQTGSCGAHFFVRDGNLFWCIDEPPRRMDFRI